jgi:hypothetical protein
MDNVKEILEKILAVLQMVGKYVALAIEWIVKIIGWLTVAVGGYLANLAKAVFGVKK